MNRFRSDPTHIQKLIQLYNTTHSCSTTITKQIKTKRNKLKNQDTN